VNWAGAFAGKWTIVMSEENLDRIARDELSPAEARVLAQEALDDRELFEQLTYLSVARAELAKRPPPAQRRLLAIFAVAATVVLAVLLYPLARNVPAHPQAAAYTPPILLARDADSSGADFRGVETDSREPRATGLIESIDGHTAVIDLGSLDGLAKGDELAVLRAGQVVGRIKIAVIFRDHARGEIEGASLREHDQVRVSPAVNIRALLDEIEAAMTRGNPGAARNIAKNASVESFDVSLTDPDDLNNAGVMAELHGNRVKAGEFYQRALQRNLSARQRDAVEKNFARWKAGE
jgi:hypothetical protein